MQQYNWNISAQNIVDGLKNIKNNTGLTINNTGNRSFYIGAFHAASSAGYGGANTVDYLWLGSNYNWTDNEQLFMYNTFNALQTILGR